MRLLTKKPAVPKRRAAPRRRVQPRWVKPLAKTGFVLALLGGLAGGGWYLWSSDTIPEAAMELRANALELTRKAGLTVADVLVEGRGRTDPGLLLAVLDVNRGDALLGIDVEAARERLESINWVRSAVIERRLPHTLYVRIEERQPMALWQRDDKLVLVDAEGVVILRDEIAAFGHLPVLVGDEAPKEAPALLAMLETAPDLRARVRAATLVGERRWNLLFDNGIDVRLPEEDPAGAWTRLAALEREHKVLAKDVVAIDLRFADRLVVRVAPETAKRLRNPGKNT